MAETDDSTRVFATTMVVLGMVMAAFAVFLVLSTCCGRSAVATVQELVADSSSRRAWGSLVAEKVRAFLLLGRSRSNDSSETYLSRHHPSRRNEYVSVPLTGGSDGNTNSISSSGKNNHVGHSNGNGNSNRNNNQDDGTFHFEAQPTGLFDSDSEDEHGGHDEGMDLASAYSTRFRQEQQQQQSQQQQQIPRNPVVPPQRLQDTDIFSLD